MAKKEKINNLLKELGIDINLDDIEEISFQNILNYLDNECYFNEVTPTQEDILNFVGDNDAFSDSLYIAINHMDYELEEISINLLATIRMSNELRDRFLIMEDAINNILNEVE